MEPGRERAASLGAAFLETQDLAVERATKRAASADCPNGSQSPAAAGHA